MLEYPTKRIKNKIEIEHSLELVLIGVELKGLDFCMPVKV
jgi:hypothetical protein